HTSCRNTASGSCVRMVSVMASASTSGSPPEGHQVLTSLQMFQLITVIGWPTGDDGPCWPGTSLGFGLPNSTTAIAPASAMALIAEIARTNASDRFEILVFIARQTPLLSHGVQYPAEVGPTQSNPGGFCIHRIRQQRQTPPRGNSEGSRIAKFPPPGLLQAS